MFIILLKLRYKCALHAYIAFYTIDTKQKL